MNLYQKTISIIILTLIFSSCEKVVYFEVETQENKLVVNSFIQPDSAGLMTISLSTDPLAVGFDNVRVESATVNIFRNGTLAGNFVHQGDGNYTIDAATLNAQSGDIFSIEASAPGKETITAETEIPASVEIEEAKIIDTIFVEVSYSSIDSLGNIFVIDTVVPHYKLQITFTDHEGVDFYSITINYKDAFSETYTCFTTEDPIFILGEYGGGNNEGSTVTLCNEVYFNDITFEGTKKTMEVSLLEIPTDFVLDPKFEIKLKHVSSDFYKYRITANSQFGNQDNPFAEPVIVFSNIENGYGIFAGLNTSVAEIEL